MLKCVLIFRQGPGNPEHVAPVVNGPHSTDLIFISLKPASLRDLCHQLIVGRKKSSGCAWIGNKNGTDVINFPSFLKAVNKLGYKGTLALEYEAEGDDPLPGMMESFGYIKGILATM
ncbi:MAG: sugar phosphate isomerase/epimerase [Draconibacterium sp.]|nr:sugar phosphate isomerase/epimerase [Draconibacterium sp.]